MLYRIAFYQSTVNSRSGMEILRAVKYRLTDHPAIHTVNLLSQSLFLFLLNSNAAYQFTKLTLHLECCLFMLRNIQLYFRSSDTIKYSM